MPHLYSNILYNYYITYNIIFYASITDTIRHILIQYKHTMYTSVINKLIRVRDISEKLLYPVIANVKILLEQFGLVPHT